MDRATLPHAKSTISRRTPSAVKLAFHDTDADILASFLADASDTRDFLKLFRWQAERGSRPTRRHARDDPRDDAGEDVGVGCRGMRP